MKTERYCASALFLFILISGRFDRVCSSTSVLDQDIRKPEIKDEKLASRSSKSNNDLPEIFGRKIAHYIPQILLRREADNQDHGGSNLIQDSYSVVDPSPSPMYGIPEENESSGYGGYGGGYGSGSGQKSKGIGGKIAGGVIGIVAVSLLGLLAIPLLLIPLGVIALVAYNFPFIVVIELPEADPNNQFRNMRSVLESGSCIERIACQIGRSSGTSLKTIMKWMPSQISANNLVQRVSRGFEGKDCLSYSCNVPAMRKLF